MFCPKCGRPINENANFCGGCGLSSAEMKNMLNAQKTAETTAEYSETETFGAEESTVPAEEYAQNNYDRDVKNDIGVVNSYTYKTGNSAASYPQANSYSAPVEKDQTLSTVDFIWMMVISGLPVIGFFYLIYLAFQNNNINKRSYARAVLIVGIFAVVVGIMFFAGFVSTGLLRYY